MKKVFIAVTLSSLVFAGFAIKNARDNPPAAATAYSVSSETISEGNIRLKYPQITGLADESKQAAVNELIKNDLWQTEVQATIDAYEADYPNIKDEMGLKLDYKIELQTPRLLSVLYTGTGNIEGRYSGYEVYAITVDLDEAKKLRLSDFTAVDTKFADQVLQSSKISGPGVNADTREDTLIDIRNNTPQSLIEGFEAGAAYYTFYLTPDALTVSVPISHAGGDYALVELPGQYADKYKE